MLENVLERRAEQWVKSASKEELEEISIFLENNEIIGKFHSRKKIPAFNEDRESAIMMVLKRRPCTAVDLGQLLHIHPAELNKYLQYLLETKQIECEDQARGRFYKWMRQ